MSETEPATPAEQPDEPAAGEETIAEPATPAVQPDAEPEVPAEPEPFAEPTHGDDTPSGGA